LDFDDTFFKSVKVQMMLHLIDRSSNIKKAAQELGWSCETRRISELNDVTQVPLEPGMAFVSPANALGFMDGGIDLAYSFKMFPGIEKRVKQVIKSDKFRDKLGRPYLPIGRAIVVPTQVQGVSLISAPTMWLPQDVSDTHNAYHSTYAALKAAASENVRQVYVSGFCTGYGKMLPEESVRQMMLAHEDFMASLPPRFSEEEIVREQPLWYENVDFKDINPSDVRRRV
jgi:O-acetyl-ADP-ribose deacetylase (regulator of RNase III)